MQRIIISFQFSKQNEHILLRKQHTMKQILNDIQIVTSSQFSCLFRDRDRYLTDFLVHFLIMMGATYQHNMVILAASSMF